MIGVVLIVVQIRVLAGGQTWDDVRYHAQVAPPRLAAAAAVQGGALPMWWDGSGLGVALAGEPAHAALYPPAWLAATPRALDLLQLAHLAWLAVGVALWARRRASDHGALLAGVLVVTGGIAMSAALRGALPGLAHLPWLGAAASALASATRRRQQARAACAIGALLAAVALAGELALLVDGVALVIAIAAPRSAARWLVAAIVAGLAIGAAQWLPALWQVHGEAGAEVAGLPLARLVELIVPGAFGGDHAVAAIAGAAPWAPSVYVGAPLFALAAVRAPARRMLALILGLGALALIAGRGGWPAWLGAPELHLAALAVVLAPLAADGLDALMRGQPRAVIALGAGAGLSALALAAVGVLSARHPDVALDRVLLDGALGAVCVAGAAVLAWRQPGRHPAILLALLVAPAVGAGHAFAPVVDRAAVREPPAWIQLARDAQPPDEHSAPLRAFRPVFVDERGSPDEHGALADAVATFAGASSWRWGIAAARSEDPARSALHDRTWLAAAREGGALLDRYGVALAILPSTMINPRHFDALGRRGGWALVRLPVAPAAAVMASWLWSADADNALDLLFPGGGGAGIARGTVVLTGRGQAGPAITREPRACGIERWQPGDIALACTADAPAYAAVSSSAAAGWTVTVDGVLTDWQTADVLRRAVTLSAGAHAIRWRYITPGLPAGLLTALAGLALLCVLLVLGRQREDDPQAN